MRASHREASKRSQNVKRAFRVFLPLGPQVDNPDIPTGRNPAPNSSRPKASCKGHTPLLYSCILGQSCCCNDRTDRAVIHFRSSCFRIAGSTTFHHSTSVVRCSRSARNRQTDSWGIDSGRTPWTPPCCDPLFQRSPWLSLSASHSFSLYLWRGPRPSSARSLLMRSTHSCPKSRKSSVYTRAVGLCEE